MIEVLLYAVAHDAGSVVVFKGTICDERDPGNKEVLVTVDCACAQWAVDQIEYDGSAIVDVEEWQLS